MQKPTFLQRFGLIAAMFVPFLGYAAGEWLIAHVEAARQLDVMLKPYAFNASLLFGLTVGLVQLGWIFWRSKKISGYAVQMLAFLLAFTLVPLAFGHFVHGLSTFGLVSVGFAGVYAVDSLLGGPLFLAFPRHFAPEIRDRLDDPRVHRVMLHLEWAFVTLWLLKGTFVLWGNVALPKAIYLLLLPFFAKFIWVTYGGFCMAYPKWVRSRAARMQAAAS